ncbi:MAG: carbonic anhydrase [Aquiluna sp.]
MSRPATAQQAWDLLSEGNRNFVNGTPAHPRQDAEMRVELADQQAPFAALFGCSDSRLSAEMIFDVGLGDLFVVRNAGQVIADTILGSLEFSVEVLKVPLILVLGHDECGAVKASLDSELGKLSTSGEFIRNLVDRIRPTIERSLAAGENTLDQLTHNHIQDTIEELVERSGLIRSYIESGRLAVVGAEYRLAEGRVSMISAIGPLRKDG